MSQPRSGCAGWWRSPRGRRTISAASSHARPSFLLLLLPLYLVGCESALHGGQASPVPADGFVVGVDLAGAAVTADGGAQDSAGRVLDQGSSERGPTSDDLAIAGGDAGSVDGDNGATSDHKTTIQDFSRDQTIFGAGNVQRPVGAEIPHRGTTDAPDGAKIEVRYVAPGPLGEVYPWQVVAAAKSGKWSGVRNIPRTPGWLLAEARVQRSSAAASRQTTRFAAGIVVFHEDQSNTHQGLKKALDGVAKANGGAIPVTIGNAPGDFQLLWRGDKGNDLLPIKRVHDGNKHTTSVAAMARTFHLAAPGIKVLYVFETLSGSWPNSPLFDGTGKQGSGERNFSVAKHLADTVHADGAKVDAYYADHFTGTNSAITWLLGAYLGRDASDARRPELKFSTTSFPTAEIAGLPVNHVWPSIYPEFVDRTIYARVKGRHNYALGEGDKNNKEYRTYSSSVDSAMLGNGDRAWYAGHFDLMYQSGASGVHWDGADLRWGMPRRFRIYAAGALRATGAIATTIPKWDHVSRAADGSYVDVWSSVGPVTTRARVEHGASAKGFSFHPKAQVLGFSYPDGVEIERTELIDAQGKPAAAGRVRIFANAGRPFTAAANEPVYLRGTGGMVLSSGEDRHDYHAAGQYEHYPVVDVGIPTIAGQLVHPAGATGQTFLTDAPHKH